MGGCRGGKQLHHSAIDPVEHEEREQQDSAGDAIQPNQKFEQRQDLLLAGEGQWRKWAKYMVRGESDCNAELVRRKDEGWSGMCNYVAPTWNYFLSNLVSKGKQKR